MSGTTPASRRPLPEEAWLAVLCELPGMWPTRLAALLGLERSAPGDAPGPPATPPADRWRDLLRGAVDPDDPTLARRCLPRPREVVGDWARAAREVDVDRRWAAYEAAGVHVRLLGGEGYPDVLAAGHRPPWVVFARGNAAALTAPRVAIVGTRRCTPAGREIAFDLGRALAGSGVCVLSGLALGIDGAAHGGALAAGASLSQVAPPVGVVAGGLDRPYPSRHRDLWHQVASAGALLSQFPLGTPHESWRFASRNRVLVLLAEAVVVVESHTEGGSIVTANEALGLGVPVLAVPGSIRSPASAGTNRLLRDGAAPVCDVDDVLAALALERAASPLVLPAIAPVARGGAGSTSAQAASTQAAPAKTGSAPALSDGTREVLEAVDWTATPTDLVLARVDRSPGQVATELNRLLTDGWVRGGPGWWERVG